MKLEVLSTPTSYKTDDSPQTPYQRAKAEWDDRLGSSLIQAKNWRLFAFIASAGTVALGISLAFEVNRRAVVPIIVGVNPISGEPTVLGDVAQMRKDPSDLEIKYFLSEFIRLVRTVPMDPVLLKQNWLRGYAFLRKDAASYLNELANRDTDSPLKKPGKAAVSIQPLSVMKIPETNSYQIRWREEVYSASNMKSDEYTMLGTFSLEFEAPKDELAINNNPLGIFIKTFQWNREL